MKTILTLLLAAALAAPIQFDKTVHDFGEISTKAGKQTCTFTVTNDSDEDLSINIYTLSGQLVESLRASMSGGYGEVAVRMMAEGCYVARATGKSGKTASCKFVF